MVPDNRLVVLTYNVHKGFSPGNRRFVLHQIRSALVAADADVLCLQEMQGEHNGHEKRINAWPDCAQAEYLAGKSWPYFAYGQNANYSTGHHGNALLSKFPLLNWENINVSPFRQASRSLLHGVLQIQGIGLPLHIICLHFGLLAGERQKQITSLCARIDNHVPGNAPLVVAGDFNDWRGVAESRFSSHLDLQDAFHNLHGHRAKTFPAWFPCLPVDRIYYRGLQLLSCERLMYKPWPHLSDHVPLAARFRL